QIGFGRGILARFQGDQAVDELTFAIADQGDDRSPEVQLVAGRLQRGELQPETEPFTQVQMTAARNAKQARLNLSRPLVENQHRAETILRTNGQVELAIRGRRSQTARPNRKFTVDPNADLVAGAGRADGVLEGRVEAVGRVVASRVDDACLALFQVRAGQLTPVVAGDEGLDPEQAVVTFRQAHLAQPILDLEGGPHPLQGGNGRLRARAVELQGINDIFQPAQREL